MIIPKKKYFCDTSYVVLFSYIYFIRPQKLGRGRNKLNFKNIFVRKKSTPPGFSWYWSAVGAWKIKYMYTLYFHLFNTVPNNELFPKFHIIILSMTGTYLRTFSHRSPARTPGNSHRSSSAPPPGHTADYSYRCPGRTGE